MSKIHKITELQIDEVVVGLKELFLSQAQDRQEVDKINRWSDDLRDEAGFVFANVDAEEIYESAINKIALDKE